MNESNHVFNYLKSSLIAWKPYTTTGDTKDQGFDDASVVNVELGSIPGETVFDYVFMSPPITTGGGLTTGSPGTQRITQTFNIDIYCRRRGVGKTQKINTLNGMYEIKEFIENIFSKQGFLFTSPIPDMDYTGNSTTRQTIIITRTFTKI